MADIDDWLIQAFSLFYNHFQALSQSSLYMLFSNLPRSHPIIPRLETSLALRKPLICWYSRSRSAIAVKERLLCLRVFEFSWVCLRWPGLVLIAAHLFTQPLVSHPAEKPSKPLAEERIGCSQPAEKGKTHPESSPSPLIH